MSLEDSLNELCINLTSNRATERKKSAEKLKDFLTRNAVPSLLSANTLKMSGLTWNNIFDDINNYIILESNKMESSKNFKSVTVPLCKSLLHSCIAGSNKGKAYLKSEKVTDACLNILNDRRLASAVGDAYLTLLYKYVFPVDFYVGTISSSTWEDILEVSLTMSNKSELDDYAKMRLILSIVKNATSSCQFVIPLRDSLPKLLKYFTKIANDQKVQEFVMETIIVIVDTIKSESRLTMCEFTESILPMIFKFYVQSLEQKKKSLLFNLLKITMNMRNVPERDENMENSIGHDDKAWKRHLNNILEIACLEIEYIQKTRKQNDAIECKDFFYVAASAFYQDFCAPDESNEDVSGSSVKRLRVSFNKIRSFEDLIQELKYNPIPWIGIIEMYIKHYGSSLTTADYMSLIKTSDHILSNAHKESNFEALEQLICMSVESVREEDYSDTYNVTLVLWNTCLRNVAVSNVSNKAVHSIIRSILNLNLLKYKIVQPLLLLYIEKGMPVNTISINTLSVILNKFHSKCCYLDVKMKLLSWVTRGNVVDIDNDAFENILLRLLSTVNISIKNNNIHLNEECFYQSLASPQFDIFNTSPQETTLQKHIESTEMENIEICSELNTLILQFLEELMSLSIDKFKEKQIGLKEFTRVINVACIYFNVLLKFNLKASKDVKETILFTYLQKSMKLLYTNLTTTLNSDAVIKDKIIALKCVQSLLTSEYVELLNIEVRKYIDDDCFHAISAAMKVEAEDEEEICYEDDMEVNKNGLKQNCIYTLASYCRKRCAYSEELLNCVLDRDLYDFKSPWDIECAIKCIKIVVDPGVEARRLDLIFGLMQNMCRELFRNPKATGELLQILSKILNEIWYLDNHGTLRKNSAIMVKSYLSRCSKFYPPPVAALVYECVAKVIELNNKEDVDLDESFREALVDRIKGDTHTVRLFCCHMLKYVARDFTDSDVESLGETLKDVFITNITSEKETVIKDELADRTLTVLYSFYTLGITKSSLVNKIIVTTLTLQVEKTMNKVLVYQMLNKLTQHITSLNIEQYLNNNIVYILHYWFKIKKKTFEELPFYFFGCKDSKGFVEKHMIWLIPTETLWRCHGHIEQSVSLKYICAHAGRPKEEIIEACFCNVIILCLPYIVVSKYKLENERDIKSGSESANRLFQATRQLLNNDKWSNLFVENLGELLRLTAAHTHAGAHARTHTYTFSKDVFNAILKYFGELIDGNIMQYLCETQSLVLFNILFKLWTTVATEKVLDIRKDSFHTYLNFIESIPLGFTSDALLFNFICSSVIHAIKLSKSDFEIRLFTEGLIGILKKIMSNTAKDSCFLRKSLISDILSITSVKKDEGITSCDKLHEFLKNDFADYFAESLDVVDQVNVLDTSSQIEFVDKLKSYTMSLTNASPQTLSNMLVLLKQNRNIVKSLTLKLNVKGFSDDCGDSIIHQTISALCNVLKVSTNEKVTIAASDCLSEIGSYDLKTLVTVPPLDGSRLLTIHPKVYLAIQVLATLSSLLADADTTVTNKVAVAINRLLTFRDGKTALDFSDHKMLSSLSPGSCETYSEFQIDGDKFDSCNTIGYWVPSKHEDHDTWVTRVTMSLLNLLDSPSNYISALASVCSVKPSVCCKVLPSVFGQVLECASEAQTRALGEQIDHVFKYIWDVSFEESLESSDDANNSRAPSVIDHNLKMIIHSLLDIVNFVRIQREHYSIRRSSVQDDWNYLSLEYRKVSWAAAAADDHLAAVYYGELGLAARPDEHIQNIFRKCFMAIGELDAIDGCGIAHLTREEDRRRHLISTGQYTDALLLHDIALARHPERHPEGHLRRGTAVTLHKCGMHHLALQYIKSLPDGDELNDVKYDCLAYLGDWSDFVDTKELHEQSKKMITNPKTVVKAMRYACLKDCLTIQPNKFDKRLEGPLDRAKLAAARLCKNLNMENCQNVYKIVGNLQVVRDIEEYFSVRCDDVSMDRLIEMWSVEALPPFNDFKHLETIISQRTLILEHAASAYPSHVDQINALQLQYAELGLSNERIQMAQRVVAAMKHIEQSEKVTLLESQISWAKGHRDIALSLLSSLLSNQSEDMRWTAISLRQYGLWMAECKRENARDILNNYLEKSRSILNNTSDTETQLKVYYDIAKFADEEYKQVASYMKSSVFENKVKCIEDMKGTAASLETSQQPLTKDAKRDMIRFQRLNNGFRDLDEADVANTIAEKESFLKLALRYYLLSLAQSGENDLSVFRVISLWFDNPTLELEDAESGRLAQLLHAVPAWKFVAVLPQIAPRLTNRRDQFSEHLRKLILRCATEHPHHTLPILFSLKNSDKDQSMLTASAGEGPSAGAGAEERCACAAALVARLCTPAAPLAAVVRQMELVCDATIGFAYLVPESKALKPQPIPRTEPISKLRHLDAVPIPTDTIPVRKDCDYSRIITLSSFDNRFELVGGINYPKKISCLGSDGKKRILLIKGEDDLRQDAVMQQVFVIVNTLLRRDPVTYRAKLNIRTYKVVPMSRRAGALEWVEGTRPLGAYLLPAHQRYRPQDMTPTAARNKLKECHERRKPSKHKQQVFQQILSVFRPVFQHFFTEHYLTPVKWYERRLAYTKSVAASSMVGYILGLGDRHVQNILIDETTAEVVHIDFGIAFDQGKTLPTPETVPFRLTQDIVAGFGSSGVEGVFRRCCEKTMQLLRDNQETLLTILEVLLCDPLYLWIVSSNKNTASGGAGALAERALLAVGDKLRGADGRAGGVAVRGHVAGLLRAAADPANLAQLFPGWQPYL